jgi:hypothetical protein
MQARDGKTKKHVWAGAVVLLVVAAGLVAYVGLADKQPVYHSPGGEYSVHYPQDWEPALANGIAIFSPKGHNTADKANVTIVVSAMKPDWAKDFEQSLAKGLEAVGARYALLEKSSSANQGSPVSKYVYSVTIHGRTLKNTVYVFELAKDKAAVMTCSGLAPREAARESQFQLFADTFQAQ